MYLSRRFRCDRSAESSSVVREREARAEEMSCSGDWDGEASFGGVVGMVDGEEGNDLKIQGRCDDCRVRVAFQDHQMQIEDYIPSHSVY